MTTLITISTHVLDTALGTPAANIPVTLAQLGEGGAVTVLANGVTNADGRVPALAPVDGSLSGGSYRLCFDVAGYFASSGRESFYTEICIAFTASTPQHYHVPLLLSPFGYSTYRGS